MIRSRALAGAVLGLTAIGCAVAPRVPPAGKQPPAQAELLGSDRDDTPMLLGEGIRLMGADAHMAEARLALAERNYRQAAGAARAAIAADPSRSEATLVEATARAAMGDLAGALPLWEGLVREGEGGTTPVSAYAALAVRRGLGAEALDLLQQRIQALPDDADLHGIAGWVALAIGRTAEARVYLEATWGTETSARYALALGRARLLTGDLDGAAEAAERARESNEGTNVWVLLGDVRRAMESTAGAAQAYRKALEFDPQNYGAQVNLGVLKLSQGDAEGAASLFAAATQARPKTPDAWNNLGLARRAQGDLSGAQEAYEQALAVAPGFAPTLKNLGILQEKYLGQPAAAVPYYDRYLELRPTDEVVSRWRKIAERLAREEKQ